VFTCQPSVCNAQGGNSGAFEWQGKLFAQSMKAVFFPHGCCTAQLASSQARRRSESRAIFCRALQKPTSHPDHTLVRSYPACDFLDSVHINHETKGVLGVPVQLG
jgi:hypothetical protein